MVNACYIAEYNSMYVPAAMMEPPFLYSDNILTSYAGLGRILAHEMSHAVDSQGKEVDAGGLIRDWWTKKDKEVYEANQEKLKDLYQFYYPGLNVNLTLTENISDFIALRVAWTAYQDRWIKEFQKPVDKDNQHSFFEQLAYTRLFKAKKKYREYALKHDVHAPFDVRTNVPLLAFQPFLDLFGLKGYPEEKRPRFF